MSRRAESAWEERGSRERAGEDLRSSAFGGQGRAHMQKRERVSLVRSMSLSPRGRGQAGEPVAGTSRVSLVHAVSWAGARSLGARMLRHRESIVLKMYSSLGNVTNKRTGLRVHTEEEPWRSVNVCFRLDTLSQRCYCKMYVNTQGAVRVLSSISVSIGCPPTSLPELEGCGLSLADSSHPPVACTGPIMFLISLAKYFLQGK